MKLLQIFQLIAAFVVFSIFLLKYEISITGINSYFDPVIEPPMIREGDLRIVNKDEPINILETHTTNQIGFESTVYYIDPKSTEEQIDPEPTESDRLTILVKYPQKMSKCFPATILINVKDKQTELDEEILLHQLQTQMDIIAECEMFIQQEAFTIQRKLPVIPSIRWRLLDEQYADKPDFISFFYPDEATVRCSITVSSSRFNIEEAESQEYKITEIPRARPWCWNCIGKSSILWHFSTQLIIFTKK